MSVPGGRPLTSVPIELGIAPGWDPAAMTVSEHGIEGISAEVNGRQGKDASMYGGWGWWGPGWGGPWWGFRGPAVIGPSVVVVNNCGGRPGPEVDGGGQVRPGAGVVGTGSSPPSGAQPGGLWWDNVSGNLYVNYDDGTSRQWVSAMATTGGGGIADAPSDGNTYARKLNEWVSVWDSGRV